MRAISIEEYDRERAAAKRSSLEERMALILRAMAQDWPEMPVFESEYRFHPTRRYKFDFASKEAMVALECEGGIWSGGRHVRGNGYAEDCLKYNEAALLGWTVLRFTSGMIDNTRYVERTIRQALEAR